MTLELAAMKSSPERISRLYMVSWTSMMRIADSLWGRHAECLINESAGPEELVALFGLSYVTEQLEASWDLNNLCKYRSAKTTLRSSLEGLFQIAAVANCSNPEARRGIAVRILGLEISRKQARLEQIRNEIGNAGEDNEMLDIWESDLAEKTANFQRQFGEQPSKIPITQLAAMGGIGGHYAAYMDDKMFSHHGLDHLDSDPSERESLRITQDCCNYMMSTLEAVSQVLEDDIEHLLQPNRNRLTRLAEEFEDAA
jgi:hypothetical protein